MIQFSGNNAARLALNILKSIQQVIRITRLQGEGKEHVFLDCVRGTLDRAKILADMVRVEVKKNETQEVPSHLSLLQKLENQIVNLRDLLIGTIKIAKRGLYNPDSIATVLNNSIRNTGRTVKEIIVTAKEIESLFPKETGSVLDSITHGEFRSEYPSTVDENSFDEPDQSVTMEEGEETSLSSSRVTSATTLHPNLDVNGEGARPAGIPRPDSVQTATADSYTSKMDTGVDLFNLKWKKGLQYLIKERLIKEDTKSIAQFLNDYNERLSKEQMGEILAGRNEDDVELLTEFTNLMDFKGDRFDHGLRKYLKKFMLPGEAQKISRIMEVFATGYLEQNPSIFPNKDVAFVLAFSLIMLNTDAHNPAIAAKDKMTKEQFIWNNRGTWVDGADPPKELLEELYDQIVNDEIKMQTKGDPDKKGWLKGIHAGSIKEGRRWFLLVGNELRWYKSPVVTTTGKEEEMRGKIILECMQVRDDDEEKKFSLSSVLPNKNIDFYLYEKGGKEIMLSCKRFVISAESPEQTVSWAKAIRANVSLEEIPSKLEQGLKNSPKTTHRKAARGKNKAWRNSFANGQSTVPTGGISKQQQQIGKKKSHHIKVTPAITEQSKLPATATTAATTATTVTTTNSILLPPPLPIPSTLPPVLKVPSSSLPTPKQ